MPNAQDTEDAELQLEVDTEAESVGDTQNTSNEAEGESEDTQVDLEKETPAAEKLSPHEESIKRQEEAWLGNIISGKKAVTDAPSWLQGRLQSRLDATNKAPAIEEVVAQALAKKEEESEFKNLQAQIPTLTVQQAKELTERFNTLKPAGKVVALKAALDAMGLSQKVKEAEKRGIAKGRMSLPKSGQPAVRKSEQTIVGGVPLDTINDEKKWNEMIRNGKA